MRDLDDPSSMDKCSCFMKLFNVQEGSDVREETIFHKIWTGGGQYFTERNLLQMIDMKYLAKAESCFQRPKVRMEYHQKSYWKSFWR